MGAAYTVFGKQVPAHILSILTLSTVVAGVTIPQLFKKEEKNVAPKPVPAAPKEDDFDLEKFINDLTKEEKK